MQCIGSIVVFFRTLSDTAIADYQRWLSWGSFCDFLLAQKRMGCDAFRCLCSCAPWPFPADPVASGCLFLLWLSNAPTHRPVMLIIYLKVYKYIQIKQKHEQEKFSYPLVKLFAVKQHAFGRRIVNIRLHLLHSPQMIFIFLTLGFSFPLLWHLVDRSILLFALVNENDRTPN